ncbi:MAG TPA: hypothetical protein VIL07_06360 [Symbiobacteriaceae bacterium]
MPIPMPPLSWQFWIIVLALAIIILLLWRVSSLLTRRSDMPYRTLGELEDAYRKGALSWEEYDRWRRRFNQR